MYELCLCLRERQRRSKFENHGVEMNNNYDLPDVSMIIFLIYYFFINMAEIWSGIYIGMASKLFHTYICQRYCSNMYINRLIYWNKYNEKIPNQHKCKHGSMIYIFIFFVLGWKERNKQLLERVQRDFEIWRSCSKWIEDALERLI